MRSYGGLLTRSISLGLMLAAGSAFGQITSVDDVGLFELDGNATNVVATPGDDWDQIYCKFNASYAGCSGIADPSGSLFRSVFANDRVEDSADDISAGAKDSLDIRLNVPQDWAWKIGEPNDKNDIEQAFAAIYRGGPNNDFYLYFGLTKLSNDGDAAIGFWFLQNDVGKTNEALGGGYRFSAGHVLGDVLVQSNFTNGGEVSRANVYTWGANGALNEPIAPSQGLLTKAWDAAVCDPLAFTEDACVRVNTASVPAPWPYIYKFSGGVDSSENFPTATFFEGGLNLTKLFGGDIPCISTFVGETRQSQSETAELEDFVLAQFKLCSIDVAKTGPDNGKVGDYDLSYKITITNDGALTLSRYSIIDSLQGDLTNAANYSSSTCGATLAAGQSCEITYTRTAGTSSPVDNKVDVVYRRVTATRTDTVSDSDTESVPLKKPAVDLNKSSPSEGKTIFTYVPVKYDFDVKNTGDTTLNCVLSDPMFGEDFEVTITGLAAGATYSASYDYDGFGTAGTKTNTASVTCDVVGFSNKVSDSDAVSLTVIARAPAVTVMKTGDDYSKLGDTVSYSVKISNLTILPVDLNAIMDSLAGDLKTTNAPVTSNTCASTTPAYRLAGNTDCTITYTYTVIAADLVSPPLDNEVNVTWADTDVGAETTVGDDHEVTLVSPNYTIAKTCGPDPVPAGSTVNFDIKVTNTGDVPLNVKVTDSKLGIDTTALLGKVSGSCAEINYDSDASDGCWLLSGSMTATGSFVENTADASGTLPEMYKLDNKIDKSASSKCTVQQNGATRTPGFWKTHGSDATEFDSPVEYGYTCHIFRDHLGGSASLGWRQMTSCEDVFGVFWANRAQETTGARRSAVCQARVGGSFQLMAAILNSGLDNGATVPADPYGQYANAIQALQAALAAGDQKKITKLAGVLGAYNQSFDTVAIVDDDGAAIPHADPNGTRDEANLAIMNCQ